MELRRPHKQGTFRTSIATRIGWGTQYPGPARRKQARACQRTIMMRANHPRLQEMFGVQESQWLLCPLVGTYPGRRRTGNPPEMTCPELFAVRIHRGR